MCTVITDFSKSIVFGAVFSAAHTGCKSSAHSKKSLRIAHHLLLDFVGMTLIVWYGRAPLSAALSVLTQLKAKASPIREASDVVTACSSEVKDPASPGTDGELPTLLLRCALDNAEMSKECLA